MNLCQRIKKQLLPVFFFSSLYLLLSGVSCATVRRDKKLVEESMQTDWIWALNTSNPSKQKDFAELFQRYGGIVLWKTTDMDLHEIDADPISVVVHKASQLEDGTIVEDSSFDVEGENLGVNIRWLVNNLSQFGGRRASLNTLIAFKIKGRVFVYEGKVIGTVINPPRGPFVKGFIINPYFLPDGRDLTLAEHSDDEINPRAIAVRNLLDRKHTAVRNEIKNWNGKWQTEDEIPTNLKFSHNK